jgi:hypothetical protein
MMRNLSTGGFIMGLLGAGVGAILLLADSRDTHTSNGAFRSSSGFGSARTSWAF